MEIDVAVIGLGGFSRQCIYLIEEMNAAALEPRLNLVGCVDDCFDPECETQQAVLERLQVDFIGNLDTFINNFGTDTRFVVAIADSNIRKRITEKLTGLGYRPQTLIHPLVRPHRTVSIGEGCVICKGVTIDLLVTLGNGVHINNNCTIGHDATLEEYVTLAPLVSIGGWTQIQAGVFVGANAAVLQNLMIGASSKVGAAACVIGNVPEGVTVKGVPAK